MTERVADRGATFELEEKWRCPSCNKLKFFGGWVAAHWDAAIVTRCECGCEIHFLRGKVQKVRGNGQGKKTSPRSDGSFHTTEQVDTTLGIAAAKLERRKKNWS